MLTYKETKSFIKKDIRLFISIQKDKRISIIPKIILYISLTSPITFPILIFIALKFIPRRIYKEYHDKIFGKKVPYPVDLLINEFID